MTKRVEIPVGLLEFDQGGNTVWIQGWDGGTVLRIKTTGTITARNNCNVASHSDAIVQGDIHFCLADDARVGAQPGRETPVDRAIAILSEADGPDAPLNTNDLYEIIDRALAALGADKRGT